MERGGVGKKVTKNEETAESARDHREVVLAGLEVGPQRALLDLGRLRVGHDVDGQRRRPAVVIEQLAVGHAKEHGGVAKGRGWKEEELIEE